MKTRFLVLALHLGIFFTLLAGFEHYVAVIFAYDGYFYQPEAGSLALAAGLAVLLSLLTPVAARRPSTLLYQCTLIFVLLPMMVLYHAERKPLEHALYPILAYAVSVALPQFVPLRAPRFSLVSMRNLQGILLAAALLYIVMVFLMGGGAYLNFDLSKVYDFREEAAENLPGVFGYISPLVGKVVVPIAFVLSLIFRKWLMAGAMFCAAVLMFGLTAHKSTLFSPFLILLIYLISRKDNLALKLNLVMLLILLLTLGDFWVAAQQDDGSFGWFGNFFMRRVFFVPANINYLYYEFFSQHEFVFFSNSKFSLGLIDYPYPLQPAHLIGREYFNTDHLGANTGWLGSGYMQAGLTGLVLYGAAVGLMFRYIDACARATGERALITAAVAVPVFALVTSSDLPTALLTHGLYLNLLLIACFHAKEHPHDVHAHRPSQQRSLA